MAATTRKALVTGATSGIGRAIAAALAAQGARVLLTGRDAKRGESVASAIRAAQGNAEFMAADLGSAASVADLAGHAERILGGVDILVNNAGVFSFGPAIEATEAMFDTMYATNVKAPLLLTARLAPGMVRRRWGRIINITTMAAHIGLPGAAVYGSSKAALQLLTQVWAAELGPSGITSNAIAPGPVKTPGTDAMGDALEQLAKTLPAGRAGKPEEIAAAAVFLASDGAAFVNGATLAVDGGRTAI